MSGLGDTFRAARESQGLTLSDVAERIHIRSVFLAAIEAEDWTAIGPPVYIRGFVRSYARCLGLDAEAAVAQFSNRTPGGTPNVAGGTPKAPGSTLKASVSVPKAPVSTPKATVSTPVVFVAPRGESLAGRSTSSVRRRGPSLGAIVGALVASLLVLFVVYQYLDYRRTGSVAVNGQRPAMKAELPAQPGRAADDSHGSGAPAANVRPQVKNEEGPSGFALRLRDSSWLRVVVDGKVAMEGVYPAGTARTFKGRSATVRTGNAGGVEISVDGKDLGPMGGLGDVAERSFQL